MLYKTFKVFKKYYVYDVVSNNILLVSRQISNFLDRKIIFNKLSKKEKKAVVNFKKNGLFKTKGFNKFKFNFWDKFNDYLLLTKSNIKKLTIVINEKCNFDCKYCLYGDNYKYRKQLNNSEIKTETAKKAIGFYLKNSKNIKQKNITFYGGEPLINKEKFFKIINYARKKYNADSLRINLTTNGSLIDKEFVDFLSENKIFINISLDGPKQIHNKFRVNAAGKGTYNLIINKLKFIKDYNESYFKNFIGISTTINPPYNFNLIENYFKKNSISRFLKIDLSYVEEKDSDWLTSKISSDELYKLKAQKEIKAIKECTKNFLEKKIISDLYRNIFFTRLKTIQYRDKTKLGKVLEIKGPCFPGLSMLLVDTGGNFYICTMLDNEYCIGNVKSGLNSKKIKNSIKSIYSFIKLNCRNCWLIRLCHPCLSKFNRGELLLQRRNLCLYRQAVFLELLKSYIKIQHNEKINL